MISQKMLGEKIKIWREERDMSQEQFAKAIGLSRVAVSEVERGNRGVDAIELAKIAGIFNISTDALLSDNKPNKSVLVENNFNFEPKKLRNIILYILEKCGGKPNLGETVLYKLLYFIDFDNFEITGQPVTGLNYINRQFGPVPATKEYCTVVEEMQEADQLKIFSQEYYGLVQKRYVALTNYEEGTLSLKEIKVIDSVINRLSDMSARKIEDYVHEDAPWKLTKEKQTIPYCLAFDRKAPYAQVDHEMEMQDVAGSDTLKHLGEQSKEDYDYYMSL
ncbi:MAG: DUF4065 domain-containing protein [Candidatus Magasanikbacteria bacterium]|nr:DUF4065 domain-containing protein [Candidatus Magasanikbacteria bacterium]